MPSHNFCSSPTQAVLEWSDAKLDVDTQRVFVDTNEPFSALLHMTVGLLSLSQLVSPRPSEPLVELFRESDDLEQSSAIEEWLRENSAAREKGENVRRRSKANTSQPLELPSLSL